VFTQGYSVTPHPIANSKTSAFVPTSMLGVVLASILLLYPVGSSEGASHPPVPADASGVVASRTCLECHDGVIARTARARDVRAPYPVALGGSAIERERITGHPVGMEYSRAWVRRETRLRPAAMLDSAIRLEHGRVGCISCHDLDSPSRARLVRPAGGDLCLGCHDL
jgi:predicted CXXCH cytochrome family protein